MNYVDLWGLELQWKKGEGATDEDIENARQMGETIASSDTIAGERWNELVKSDKTIVIVSHSLDSIRRLCNRAVWINEGKIAMDDKCDKVVDAYLKECK